MDPIRSDLLDWIFHPVRWLQCRERMHWPLFWVVTLLCGLASISDWGISSLGAGLFFLFSSVLMVFFVCFFQAVVMDFFAQMMGQKAQSVQLFYLLVLAQIPLILCMPLGLLSDLMPPLSLLFNLGILGCYGYAVWLQFRILICCYDVSKGRGILLLVSPVLLLLLGGMGLGLGGLVWQVMM